MSQRGRWSLLFLQILSLFIVTTNLVRAYTEPLTIKGTKFFYPNGTQFFIKGVVYSSSLNPETDSYTGTTDAAVDVLADITSCSRDAQILADKSVNTISVLYSDWTRSHEECFTEFAKNDIYVIPLLESGSTTINGSYPSWNTTIYDVYTKALDEVSRYNNTLGVFAAYENVNSEQKDTSVYAMVKAAVRDSKNYINAKGYRQIPVGYAIDETEDDQLLQTINYLTCGSADEIVDFFGYSTFQWCGDSSFAGSGYRQMTDTFANSTVPAFLSEFGCELGGRTRPFYEVDAILGSNMTAVFSGGIAYEYFNYSTGYGLVTFNGSGVDYTLDFQDLAESYAAAAPSSTAFAHYTPTAFPASLCSAPSSSASVTASPTLPPLPYQMLCDCMMETLDCVVTPDSLNTITVTDENQAVMMNGGDLINSTCNTGSSEHCDGIRAYPQNGTYGAYSVCALNEQLSWIYNNDYVSNGRTGSSDCAGGSGELRTPAQSNSTCAGLLAQARSDGTGTITSYPAGTTPTAFTGGGPGGSYSSSSSDDRGLSTGAKAGIGVGVALGVIAIIAIVAFLLRRQRKAKRAREAAAAQQPYEGKPELAATERPINEVEENDAGYKQQYQQGTNGDHKHELVGGTVNEPVELPDPSWIPPEMPTNEIGR